MERVEKGERGARVGLFAAEADEGVAAGVEGLGGGEGDGEEGEGGAEDSEAGVWLCICKKSFISIM